MLNRYILAAILVIMGLLVSSCGSESERISSSSRATADLIQESLRERAYTLWDQKFIINDGMSDENVSITFDSKKPSDAIQENDDSAPSDIDINAWRSEVSAPWAEIPSDGLEFMCNLWFSWLMEPNQLDGILQNSFTNLRQNLRQVSLIPYAYDQVTLIQDNRKTIAYPRAGNPSYLIICGAEVTFETTFGSFNRTYVYLSALYELRDGKATFIFPSYSSKKIDEK